MTLTETFIRRPVATTLVMTTFLLFGIISYVLLPTADLPEVSYPTIQVTANLPGASPETMASSVATPLEKEFSDINGLVFMNSNSFQGTTTVNLQFSLDRSIDAAAQDVQAAVNNAILPSEMPQQPSITKTNAAEQPILYLALFSDMLPLIEVNRYAETFLARRISMVDGVSQVLIYGEKLYSARVQVDPKALATRKIGLDKVVSAVSAANVNTPAGLVENAHEALTLQPQGQLMKAAFYNPVIVAYQNDRPVRIQDLGQAVDGVDWKRGGAWWKGRPAIVLAIKRQPGANTIKTVGLILDLLPVARQQIPPSVELETIYDQSVSIRESVADVQFTLAMAVALVVLVVLLFLKNLSATIITSLAVPLSMIATFVVLYKLRYSLDNLSLMALTLAVGFVVDDAIVMLENIFRHMEMGKSRLQAALDGAREIGFTIISMTLSLAVVFLPVVLMSGMVGRILNEFAITITMAILVSGVVSLSLTPMLASRFLKEARKPGAAAGGEDLEEKAAHEGGFIWRPLVWLYHGLLRFCLRHRLLTMTVFFALLYGTYHLFMVVPTGFIPSEDRGMIFGMTLADEGISYEAMAQHTNAVAAVISEEPDVEGVMSIVGAGMSAINSSIIFAKMTPTKERKTSPEDLIQRLRPKTYLVPGLLTFLQNPPPIELSAQHTNAPYQYTLQSPETEELYASSQQFLERMRELREVIDANSDLMNNSPQLVVDIDRDRASALGITASQLEDALYSSFADRQVCYIYASEDTYKVKVELLPEYQREAGDVHWIYLPSRKGDMVPMGQVGLLRRQLGPLQINHVGQLPSVSLSFNIAPGFTLGEATKAVHQLAQEVLPPTVTGSFKGQAEEFENSMSSLYLLIVLALAVIYIILGILYESFIHPITILAGLPSAAFGALLTLYFFGAELNLYGMVGILMLIGIVKKNAIMMIDFALEAEREQHLSPREAIYQGAVVRFRPIMMTTVAAFAGILPIALGLGAGGDSRQPLGLAVCGGLVVSQVVTLLMTPVIYTYFDQLQSWLGRKGKKGATPEAAA